MGRDLSTSEKLASRNPARRREGKAEAAKMSSSQRSKTVSKARKLAGSGGQGYVAPSQVSGPSAAQVAASEAAPKTAGEAVRMAREFKGTPAQQQEYLRVISEKATRQQILKRQVATQPFVTRATRGTEMGAEPTGTMTRQYAEQFVRFTPGGGQYTEFYQERPVPVRGPGPSVISAAPDWLSVGTRVAKERDVFYARKDLPSYKTAPKKEPYIPPEYRKKTFLEKADIAWIKKGQRIPPPRKEVPFTDIFKGTRFYPKIKAYEEKYTEPIGRYQKQLLKEIQTKPATFTIKTGAVAAGSFAIGTGLTMLPATKAAAAIKGTVTLAGVGVAAGTAGESYLRVRGAPKGKRAEEAAKVTFDVLPVAAGLLIGGAATRGYAPAVKEYSTTRFRYYKATGKVKLGRLPLEVARGTYQYRLTSAGATTTYTRQGVPTGKQTRLVPMSRAKAEYYSEAARKYVRPAISAERLKFKPPKGEGIGRGDVTYYGIKKGYQKGIKLPKGLKSRFIKKVDIFPKAKKISLKEQLKGGMTVRQITEVKTKIRPISVFEKGDYFPRTTLKTTPVAAAFLSRQVPTYAVKTLFGLRQKPRQDVLVVPKAKLKSILDIKQIQLPKTIQRPRLAQKPALESIQTIKQAVVPRTVQLPRLDVPVPVPRGIGIPKSGEDIFRGQPEIFRTTVGKPFRPTRQARVRRPKSRFMRALKQPKAYTPTLRAVTFSIKAPKGMRKKRLTGLEERGIL